MDSLTGLEVAVASMFQVFMLNQGANGKLTKDQFSDLIKAELPHFPIADGRDIFDSVDLNEDGLVDFKEFSLLVASVAWGCYSALEKASQQTAQ